MTDLSRLRIEFPDFDFDTLPELPEGFEDNSWHNDVCPCFIKGRFCLWIAEGDKAKREYPEAPRYSLELLDEDGQHDDKAEAWLLTTDDWSEVLAKVSP